MFSKYFEDGNLAVGREILQIVIEHYDFIQLEVIVDLLTRRINVSK